MMQLVRKGQDALDSLKVVADRQKAIGTPEALVLCLDVSFSMSHNEGTVPHMKKDAALRQAADILIQESRYSAIGIVTFGNTSQVVCDVGDRVKAVMYLHDVKARMENTAMRAGLNAAAGLLRPLHGIHRVRRIMLMSDGQANDAKPQEIQSDAAKIKEEGILIDCVGFGEDADNALLDSISRIAHGRFKSAHNVRELTAAFRSLEASKRGLLGPGDKETC